MDGMADTVNLFVFASVKLYFSENLVSTVWTSEGNISLVLSFFVHFVANPLVKIDLLAFNPIMLGGFDQ